jgi:hypothetical protein
MSIQRNIASCIFLALMHKRSVLRHGEAQENVTGSETQAFLSERIKRNMFPQLLLSISIDIDNSFHILIKNSVIKRKVCIYVIPEKKRVLSGRLTKLHHFTTSLFADQD